MYLNEREPTSRSASPAETIVIQPREKHWIKTDWLHKQGAQIILLKHETDAQKTHKVITNSIAFQKKYHIFDNFRRLIENG